ncbi:hypothetical protein [Mariniflexile maritimum]|uniref:hypothetical protein n=1 Tax=Mariniflexile maritimum TaxID=2682493 RepID=UPI0012F65614|nr:hypothetical protein [Mariniflexile maritimum]
MTKKINIVLFNIESLVVSSFVKLDSSLLNILDETADYSHNSKHEFIGDMQTLFERLKEKGITSLTAKPSKCNYCYPTGKAYSFHNPDTDEFVIRYVIHQESEKVFRVEECRNIPPRKDGMPF